MQRGLQMVLLAVAVASAAYAGATVSPLQEVMRAALGLSDNQMAILQGPALALPLAIGAVPIGLAIDRYSRTRLLLILTVFDVIGSLGTARAASFAVLLGARSVIGLTSFAVNPVALSLVADLYPPAQRGRANMAIGIAQCGGIAAAFVLGGALAARFGAGADGWRLAMLGLTVPMLLVVFVVLPMREPLRTGVALEHPTLRRVLRELWGYRAVVAPILAGIMMGQIALGADYVWGAPMLSRNFGLTPEHVGTTMAAALMVSGVAGAAAGGVLADFCQRLGGPQLTVSVLAGLTLLSAPIGLFGAVSSTLCASILFILFLTAATAISVMASTLFIVVAPNELRGLCMTAVVAICVPVGNGFAPMAVSMLAQLLGGDRMIGAALSLVCVGTSVLGALAFISGRRPCYTVTRAQPL